jgi:hypothetical protein
VTVARTRGRGSRLRLRGGRPGGGRGAAGALVSCPCNTCLHGTRRLFTTPCQPYHSLLTRLPARPLSTRHFRSLYLPADAELQEMIERADSNGDGKVTAEDFIAILTRKTLG